MLLESLEVHNLRNLTGKMTCGTGLNVLVGENGQGKTNWLEAISILATTRSFKTTKLNESIRFGDDLATVRGSVRVSADIVRELSVAIQATSRTLSINGKKEFASSYVGQLYAVVFNADGLEIVRGVPDARRRFLDGGIVSIHPPYIQTITDYNRVIRQKNNLLQAVQNDQSNRGKLADALAPWNEQLIALGGRIHRSRVRYVERLNTAFQRDLFGREDIAIRYASSLEGKGDLADYESLIAERLEVRLAAEIAAGHSLIGVHRDDLEIRFDGHDLRKFGSAGQQRSALLLLLIANLTVFYAQRAEYPLFLLDDIDAELDYGRIGRLLEFLAGKTQTFVTTSKESFVENFGQNASLFHVDNGEAKSS
ncbi:MAG: DNA replication and repair protein RecF [Acidobacteriota bacterium]